MNVLVLRALVMGTVPWFKGTIYVERAGVWAWWLAVWFDCLLRDMRRRVDAWFVGKHVRTSCSCVGQRISNAMHGTCCKPNKTWYKNGVDRDVPLVE